MTRNKGKGTVTRAKAQTSKPTSTKRNSSKKPPTKKGPTKKNASQKNPTKKYSTRKKTEESQVSEKITQHWASDDNGQGKSSMYLLLNWITDEDNFSRFKDKGSYKRDVAEEVERYLIENGVTWRDASAIQKKVERLEAAWRQANDIRKGTGGGAFDAAFALKEQEKWSDKSPEWLREKKVALGPILKKCKYYFELEHIFSPRHGNTRLSAAHSVAINSDSDSDSAFEDLLRNEAAVTRNPLEHSPHSNVAYKVEEEDHEHRSLDNTFQRNLAHQVENNDDDSETMMDNLRTMFNDEGDHIRSLSPPVILTQLPASNSNATPLKRAGSKTSLNSSFESSSQKRSRTAAGSASKVQNLLQTCNLSNSFGSVTSRKELKDEEVEIISKRDDKIDRLSSLADNLVSLMFVQKEKSVLDCDQEKQKAKIEMEMAEVQLADHHQLDLQTKRAELEHQQTARNAQLIGKLMKENGLSLQEAMSAVQCATGMSSKDSTK
ncbi:hypothetical protein DFH28DRAFT_1187863 [Melampsora americana]|nr:hypothetical protein DFH28DRAFT_1187863 [Melampsora americana]